MLENNKKKKNKGFTLVELIVVIAILAILVGLLAPQYTKYVEKSRKSADVNNLNEIVNAIKVAASDPEYHLGSNKTQEDKPGELNGKLQDTHFNIMLYSWNGEDIATISIMNCDYPEDGVKALEEYAGLKGSLVQISSTNIIFNINNVKIKSHKWGDGSVNEGLCIPSGIGAQVNIDNNTDSITVTYSDNVINYSDHGTVTAKQ